jgi:hypothetical protein
MLEYDLSNTRFGKDSIRLPTEGELFAVTLALMVAEDCAFWELTERSLTLTEDNSPQVAEVIERFCYPLARDIGNGTHLRARLTQLVGIRISNSEETPAMIDDTGFGGLR